MGIAGGANRKRFDAFSINLTAWIQLATSFAERNSIEYFGSLSIYALSCSWELLFIKTFTDM